MILTDEQGREIDRPQREDYPTDVAFIRAMHEWRDTVTAVANRAFDQAWAKAVRGWKR